VRGKLHILGKNIPAWVIAVALIVTTGGAAVGVILAGQVTGTISTTASQALVVRTGSVSGGAVDAGLFTMSDNGTAFTAAAEVHTGDQYNVNLTLANHSNTELIGDLTLVAPDGITLSVAGAGNTVAGPVQTKGPNPSVWKFKLAPTNASTRTIEYTGEIQVLKLSAAGYTECLPGDIGKQVMANGVQVGTLLDYDNTKREWWIGSTSTITRGSEMLVAGDVNAAKNYNASTQVYTNETTDINSSAANDVVLPPIQTTTAGDYMYFGDATKFGTVRLNDGTAGIYTNILIVWEYWNGAWVSLSVSDGTNGFKNSGINNITWTPPADWVTNAVDSVTKYWVRARTTFNSLPSTITAAPLGTQGWQGTGAGTADSDSVSGISGEDVNGNVYIPDLVITVAVADDIDPGFYSINGTLKQVAQ